ncbi:malectin domain-containing carbohydrate-binding protein [Pedomonas mirosovicensis]|uniref:malectin domain-containing carbohydrate-binding protein n=1 Tax=Pedomonas mirosovicensis TaxID=2908641 RepID=UPI00216A7DDE|nr:malectin domain-containing carbohydrate-binding protein [Pedomonas mirosovicensis]MCH8686238.1 hypothetical protein [Pedomonas mirosovicensis]
MGPSPPSAAPHPEEFQNYILEESWKQIAERPYIWASWVWNMFDFSNELRMEGDLTDTNDKGLVTFDRRTRKDAFYFFKANWSSEPFAHITGRRYVDRPYPVVDVKAYSNAPQLELTLNGRTLGETACRQGICLWRGVMLDTGENRLDVRGTHAGKTVDDAVTWRFDGQPGQYAIRAGTLVGKRANDGRLWGSDVFFNGGKGNFRDMPSTSRGGEPGPVREVAGTADQTPYESWREGAFGYAIPVPNGTYRVTLHFFEPEATRRAGERVFSVVAEDGRAETGPIDVVKEARAPMTALTRQLNVAVADGRLDLTFMPLVGEPILSGLEVMPQK